MTRWILAAGLALLCTGCATGWGVAEMRGTATMIYEDIPAAYRRTITLVGSYPTHTECQAAVVADLDRSLKLFNPARFERLSPNTVKVRPIAGPRAGGEEFLSYQCVER